MKNMHKGVFFFIILLVVFAIIFFLAFNGLQKKQGLLGLGFDVTVENWMIMILCIASMIKIVFELYTIEKSL